ncbi:MAG TPA: TonB-dependent receptor, partial [Bryobacteraceae bacterium]|nr:TonB-dependent receptor [Bryobacteraceae bacterium]
IGRYQASAESPGFRRTVSSIEKLEINSSLRFDMQLEVGSVSETIQVEAQAVGVETVMPTLGQSVTTQAIENLPLNGRNVLDLALLQPGVTPSSPRSGASGTFSIAGGKSDSVTFLLDGGLNNNLLSNGVVFNPNPDSIQEFRILTSNYTAEYGRNAGGIISTVVRSGTNALHGSLFEYVRNDAFNANTFFNNANGVPRPILKRHQFGGSLGGPVLIPKVVSGKDRVFWFFAWQSQRQSALIQNPSVRVPTPAELSGDFSVSNATRTGPDPRVVTFLQNNPYFQSDPALAARGIINPSRVNSVTRNYIKLGLIPTSPTGTLFPQGSEKRDHDEYLGKGDILATTTDRISILLGYRKPTTLNPFSAEANVPGFPTTTTTKQYFGNVAYTKTFTPAALNEARFTAQRNDQLQAVPARKLPTPAEMGVVGITPDNPTGPPQYRLNSGLRIGFSRGGPTALVDNTYAFTDTFSWIRNRHTMKFGFFYSPYQDNTVYDFYINGRFRFYGTTGRGSGNDIADMLFGLPDQYTQFPEAPSNIRTHSYAGFAQDEWKITRKLTLSLGLRYEYNSPKEDTQGRSFSLAFNQQSQRFVKAPKGLLFPGDPGAPSGANFPDKNDWAPRFGFAYAATSRTSIRGGFGVFYDILKGEDNLQFNGQAPFFGFNSFRFPRLTSITSEVQFLIDPYRSTGNVNTFPSRPPARDIDFGANGFLPFGGGGVYFVDPHLRTPYFYQYNLSVQHEIAHALVGELSYVGSQIRKNTLLVDANPYIRGSDELQWFDLQSGVKPGNFSYLYEFKNAENGNYNSMEASLTKRYSSTRWFGSSFFTLAWTWAHALNNGEGFRESSALVPTYNWRQFYASGDNDIRHRIVFSGGWDLPFGRGAKNSYAKYAAGGWSIYPILTYRTGYALDIYSGRTPDEGIPGPSGAGDPDQVRPNLIGNMVLTFNPRNRQTFNNVTGNFYFNPANFAYPDTVPGKFTYGTLGRNAFRGPTRTNLDLAVVKSTPLGGERARIEFRAEAFNLFNSTQFRDPATATGLTMSSGTFGQISQTYDPRILQLALRLQF